MKKKSPLPPAQKPTEAELEVLGILWERKAATVREIHEALPDKDTGYTTTLKILQNMTEKGLVSRDESQRSHIYTAAGRSTRSGNSCAICCGKPSQARRRNSSCRRCRRSAPPGRSARRSVACSMNWNARTPTAEP